MWSFPPTFQGRYVALEPLSLAHLPEFLKRYDPEVFRYMSRSPKGTEEAMRAHLEALLAEPGRVNWAIRPTPALLALRPFPGLVGRISVIAPNEANARLELGTLIFKPFWGSPANKEAKYLLLAHALEVLKAQRVQFKVDLRNERSQRALEALGAVREGVLRRNRRLPDGGFRDDVVYKCPRFSFARWGAQVWSLEGLFWGPRRGSCHGGVLSLLHEEWPGVKARLLARLYGPEGRP